MGDLPHNEFINFYCLLGLIVETNLLTSCGVSEKKIVMMIYGARVD